MHSDAIGVALEQANDGSELVSATEATTWIEFAAGFVARRSIQLSYGRTVVKFYHRN
jgi:hypothetical protein